MTQTTKKQELAEAIHRIYGLTVYSDAACKKTAEIISEALEEAYRDGHKAGFIEGYAK